MPPSVQQISRLLAYLLRHHPDATVMSVDAEGWSSLVGVVHAIEAHVGRGRVNAQVVRHLVESDAEGRFSIEGELIRANYGHSLGGVAITAVERVPPAFLFFASNTGIWQKMRRRKGLVAAKNQMLPLFKTYRGAQKRAIERFGSEAEILVIDAASAYRDGQRFRFATDEVLLVDHIPADYVLNHLFDIRTVTTAGGMVVRAGEGAYHCALLHKHNHGRERWEFPKGHVEQGERVEEAAEREIREELGIEGPLACMSKIGEVEYTFRKSASTIVNKRVHFFLFATSPTAELHPAIGTEGIIGADWTPVGQIGEKLAHENLQPIWVEGTRILSSGATFQG